jgi:hypothetical protein
MVERVKRGQTKAGMVATVNVGAELERTVGEAAEINRIT